jgi:hypothetical protein
MANINYSKQNALVEIEQLMEEIQHRADQIASIYREEFPDTFQQGEAYGCFNLVGSWNRYDTTLESLFRSAAAEAQEEFEEFE